MPDAVVHPRTVVIHHQHTLPADRAVVCPKRLQSLAFPTVLEILSYPYLVNLFPPKFILSIPKLMIALPL